MASKGSGLGMRVLVAAVAVFAVAWLAAAEPRPGQPAPDIAGERWVNSAPLTMLDLRGRVVLVEFWTFG